MEAAPEHEEDAVFIGGDGEVLADMMGDEEPPNEEDFDDDEDDEDIDEEMHGRGNRGEEEDTEMDGCESGEPAITPEREDACAVLEAHTAPVFAVTHARQVSAAGAESLGTCVASGGGDDIAVIWRLQRAYSAGDVLEPAAAAAAAAGTATGGDGSSGSGSSSRWHANVLRGAHSDTVSNLSFNHDGSRLATAALDGIVAVWDAAGSLVRTFEGPGGAIEWLRWHPRGPVLLAGSEDYTAWMWNADTGVCMQVFSGHRGEVNCGSFTPDGKAVVTAGMDATLRVWSPRDGAAMAIIEGHPFHTRAISALDCHADSITILTGAEDGSVCISSAATGKVLAPLNTGRVTHSDAVEAAAFCSSNASLCASASLDGKAIIWDLNTQAHRGCLEHKDGLTCMAWHPTAPLVATAGLDSIARVWDARTGSCVRELHGHSKSILDIKFSDAGHGFDGCAASNALIVTASEDRSVRAFAFDSSTI